MDGAKTPNQVCGWDCHDVAAGEQTLEGRLRHSVGWTSE
jgi:hypothetical protein